MTLDENYFPRLQVLLTSMKINNPGTRISLYILHNRLPDILLRQTENWCREAGYDFIPVQMDETLFEGAPVSSRYPVEMYYRLLAAQMLPEKTDKVLYLDPDILIINPLNAMYGDRVLPLDDSLWNYDARNYNNYMVRSSAQYNLDWVMENTAVLHFCGKSKSWKPGYLYRFGVLYKHYEKLAKRSWKQE